MTATNDVKTVFEDQQHQLVILIDDDPLNNMVCKKFIQIVGSHDVEVVDFTDPTRGLQYVHDACSSRKSDSIRVFLDINMPVMSGWDFLEEFNKFSDICKDNIQIYIVSSTVNPADHRRAEQDPDVAGLIIKPLTRDVVRRLLN